MPNMSDTARKRTLADWVVKTKKQIVKLYAVTKWSRDANTVQKCMVKLISFSCEMFSNSFLALEHYCIPLDPKPAV
jgi:mediator of RNA polymerase II transcription subunit 14